MSSLEELQKSFKSFLFQQDDAIRHIIEDSPQVSNDLRLSIYANAYNARLVEALQTDYTALHRALGDEEFTKLAHGYIEAHPSKFYSLRWFGKYLANYIKSSPVYSQQPCLAELASLEWAFVNSFDASDREPVCEQDMASIPPEMWPALKVQFHPSVQLLSNDWNTMQLWRAVKDEENIPDPVKLPRPDNYIIWRDANTTQYRYLEDDEAIAIQVFLQGKSFVALCESLANLIDEQDVPLRAASLLKAWIAAGMIVELSW